MSFWKRLFAKKQPTKNLPTPVGQFFSRNRYEELSNKEMKDTDVETFAKMRFGLTNSFISAAQGSTLDLFEKIGGEVTEQKVAEIRNEFIYLVLHHFNRQIYSRFSEKEGQLVQALVFDALISNLSAFIKNLGKELDKDTFLKELNERENEYGRCKELDCSDNPFTSQTAIVPIFARRLAFILGYANNPEVILCAHEEAVNVLVKVYGLGEKGRIEVPRAETVLIVEDDKRLRDLIVDIVSDGHPNLRIETAADGAEALEKITHQTLPSILITNIMMPRMTGIELLTTLHRKGIVLPTIVTSGYYTHEAFEEWLSSEQITNRKQFLFLKKPFRIEQMKTWIEDIMDNTLSGSSEA